MREIAADAAVNVWQGRFSPDGRWIAFNAIKPSAAEVSTLYVVAATGGAWTKISEVDSFDDKARWATDGRSLAAAGNGDGFNFSPFCEIEPVPVSVIAPDDQRLPRRLLRATAAKTSMPEVTAAGEDHRQAVRVGGGNNFLVAHRPARLHHGRRSCLRQRVESVAEREERI